MKLNLPVQSEAAEGATPNNPRKLKKVLAALPNANMGELTKQTYSILRELNRQKMPAKHRLENLEMVRVLAREVFNNLKKYFINRTLPLPDKSQKIVNLNQSILRELVIGFEIIAHEAEQNIDPDIDDKTLSIAICHAINYLSETFLRASMVYAPCPRNLWYEAHQLYLLAETRNISDKAIVGTKEYHTDTSVAIAYKQLLLFALARPIALGQSDIERVFKELFNWSDLSVILPTANEDQVDHVFCMQLEKDMAPDYLSSEDLNNDSPKRYLDAGKLVVHLQNDIEELSKQKQKLAVGDIIPLSTLNMLANSWGVSAKRRFSRAERNEHINVSIGLGSIIKAIHLSQQKDENVDTRAGFVRTSAATKQDPDFTLENISSKQDENFQGYMTHTEVSAEEDNTWDMVSKGRTLTDTYEKEQKRLQEEKMKLRKMNADSHWQIVNISAGGYRLRWDSDDTSKAQIGELIALQETNNINSAEWRIGVIRWMQFTQEHGLEIGVQVLSPKVITATAQRLNRPQEVPFDCIMLPGIKALKQASSTVLPSHAFNTGDKLKVQIAENSLNITLGNTKELTGSFTQFTYKNTVDEQRMKKQEKKEEATKNKDDFDELWSSL